jgi:hypothetical protein
MPGLARERYVLAFLFAMPSAVLPVILFPDTSEENEMRALFPLMLIACATETEPKQFNNAPTVEIQSHSDGAELDEGVPTDFYAMVSDLNDPNEDLLASWYIGDELVCDWAAPDAAGISRCSVSLEAGDSIVAVVVTDPAQVGTRDEVAVIVEPTEAPAAAILSPVVDGSYYSDQLIHFKASASDAEDGPEALAAVWTSSIDGELVLDTAADSSGEFEDYGYLGEGQHAIDLTVTDSGGKTASESVLITVGGPNSTPVCGISAPSDGAAAVAGETVVFRGSALDDDIGSQLLAVLWISDKDGELGSSVPNSDGSVSLATSDLSPDLHTVTLSVSDEVGGNCSASILLSVGSPPVVSLTSPLDGSVHSLGDSVLFSADVSDSEDLPSAVSLVWSSDLDGELSVQGATSSGTAQFSEGGLSAGLHTVTVTATDSSGLTSDALASLRINTPPAAPSLSISPAVASTGDSILVSASPASDEDGDPIVYSYLWLRDGAATSYTSSSLPSSATSKNELWAVQVLGNDGYVDGPASEASTAISNTPPEIQNLLLLPFLPSTSDVLTCEATVSDPDETPAISYLWSILSSGQPIGVGDSLQLDPSFVSSGDTVICEATASDSDWASDSATASVLLQNDDPVITDVSISPSSPGPADLLVCTVSATDPDGDSLSSSFSWTNASTGASLGSGAELQLDSSMAASGESIECEAAVADVQGGTDSAVASVQVSNTPPVVGAASIDPAAGVQETTLLECAAEAGDAEDGVLSVVYVWTNSTTGAFLGTGAHLQLLPSLAVAGDEILCEASATDSGGATASSSVAVEVQGSGPVFISAVAIAPATGVTAASVLVCLGEAVDSQGSPLPVDYAWYLGTGTSLGSAVGSSAGAQLALGSAGVAPGDTVHCDASATDSMGTATGTDSVTVENGLPTASVVSLEGGGLDPAVVQTDDVVTATVSGTDPEGSAVVFTYRWLVDGAELLTDGPTSSVQSSLDGGLYFSKGQSLQVEVTPADGLDSGSTVPSGILTVANSGPTSPSVSVAPSAPEDYEDIVCTASGSSDADGDAVSYSYGWLQDGAPRLDLLGQDTVPSSETALGEVWECTGTASDGVDSASSSAVASVASPCPDADGDTFSCDDCDDSDPFTYPGAAYLESPADCMRDEDGDGWGDDLSDNCCYTLEMADLSGDGWDGAFLQLFDDGVLSSTYSVSSGAAESALICIPDGHLLSLSYSDGSSEADNTYTLRTPDGGLVLFQGPMPDRGQVYSETVDYSTLATCGLATEGTDCDDTDAGLNLDDADLDGATSCDGDCMDGDLAITPLTDTDGDGYVYCNDCDDGDADAFPGAAELESLHSCMRDADEDGWGDDLSRECCYTLEMTDSYNGSWDGGYLEAYADGVLLGTYAAEGGSPGAAEAHLLCTGDGGTLSLEYTAGTYEVENSYTVLAPDGTVLLSDGPSPAVGLALGHSMDFSSFSECFHGDPGSDCDDSDVFFNGDDVDGDLVSTCSGDCDDGDVSLGDIALDGDCDGSLSADDCDDADPLRSPLLEEICEDGFDNDCDVDELDSSCWAGTAVFSTCGQSGQSGPDQTQCDSTYAGGILEGLVSVADGIQYWTVPFSGSYRIEVYGAQGGYNSSQGYAGGRGAKMSGIISLVEGAQLKILVGQEGSGNDGSPSGGGGSFVSTTGDEPLIVAGGGGGAGYHYDYSYVDATTDTAGNRGYNPSRPGSSSGEAPGGTGGDGGSAGRLTPGGGGFYSSGSSTGADGGASIPGPGISYLLGGSGGDSATTHTCSGSWTSAPGGFGGGGGAGYAAAGAGGGYSGGGGSDGCDPGSGGGGGSYNSGTDPDNESGFNQGDGRVEISLE